jgi:small subunit ribosomal protein S20|tara:strand:- start:585 stop:854 length:270 start_codon:yes stop_codon:yes gene_type:complete
VANSLQAKKRAHQSEVRRRHNASQRSTYRTALKRIIAAIDGSDYDAARAVYKDSTPVMDKLTAKGIVHKNKTARHKARLNAKINALRSS